MQVAFGRRTAWSPTPREAPPPCEKMMGRVTSYAGSFSSGDESRRHLRTSLPDVFQYPTEAVWVCRQCRREGRRGDPALSFHIHVLREERQGPRCPGCPPALRCWP